SPMLVVVGSKPLVMSLNIPPLHSPSARVYDSAGQPSGYSSRDSTKPIGHSFSQSMVASIDRLGADRPGRRKNLQGAGGLLRHNAIAQCVKLGRTSQPRGGGHPPGSQALHPLHE